MSDDDVPDVARLLAVLGSGASEDAVMQFVRAGGQVLVATVLGEVAGVAVLEWLHPPQLARAEAWLTALVTGAQFRHRGVARALLAETARRVRQVGGASIHVATALERDDTRGFLSAAGFEPRLIVYEHAV